MKRYALEKLIIWKESKDRKTLIIKGARQVGKTWLMKEFGVKISIRSLKNWRKKNNITKYKNGK